MKKPNTMMFEVIKNRQLVSRREIVGSLQTATDVAKLSLEGLMEENPHERFQIIVTSNNGSRVFVPPKIPFEIERQANISGHRVERLVRGSKPHDR